MTRKGKNTTNSIQHIRTKDQTDLAKKLNSGMYGSVEDVYSIYVLKLDFRNVEVSVQRLMFISVYLQQHFAMSVKTVSQYISNWTAIINQYVLSVTLIYNSLTRSCVVYCTIFVCYTFVDILVEKLCRVLTNRLVY